MPLQLRLSIELADNYIKIDSPEERLHQRVAEAIQLLQQVRQQTNTIKDPVARAFISYLLAQSYFRAKQPQIGLELIATSRQQTTDLAELDRQQITLLVAIAKTYHTAGKPELALQVLQQGAQIVTKSSDVNLAALSLALLSNTASELGQTQLASDLFAQSIRSAKKVPNKERFTIWLGIATHFEKTAQREQLATVLQQYQNLANRQTSTTVLRNIFRQWMQVEDFNQAAPVARQLIKIAKQNRDDRALADIIDPYLERGVSKKMQPIFARIYRSRCSLYPR